MSLSDHILDQNPGASAAWPQWLLAARAHHAERLRQHGLPGRRVEEWKYTSLAALNNSALRLSAPSEYQLAGEDIDALDLPDMETHRLVFVNGHFNERLSLLDALPEEVNLSCLSAADSDQLEAARERLGEAFDAPEAAFAALNTATAGDGIILRLAAGCELDLPLECLYLSVPGGEQLALNLRNVVLLGAGARCTIIERHAAIGEAAHFSNLVNQFDLQRGARLDHIRIQVESDDAYLVTRSDAHLAADSHYGFHGFDLGGRTVRHDVNARLDEPGAACSLAGVYALDGRRHVDNHTRVDHKATRTTSAEFFKGVVDGRSRAVFNGKVVVHEGADGTDATQTNRNLVLSPHAEVDTKPELEIYADDVKCAHGATVGQLDEQQLFYLRARGLPESEARILLTYAFCREIVDQLQPESLRDHVASLVVAHLPRPEALEEIG